MKSFSDRRWFTAITLVQRIEKRPTDFIFKSAGRFFLSVRQSFFLTGLQDLQDFKKSSRSCYPVKKQSSFIR